MVKEIGKAIKPDMDVKKNEIEENLKKLNIELPNAPSPVGSMLAYKKLTI